MTVSALASRVTDVEGELVSQSNAITQTKAQTDRASASGLMRMTSSAGGTSGSTRIAIIAEAAANQVSQQAGIFIETNTNGQNDVYVLANRFAVVASRTASAARTVPFLIANGRAYMDGAEIADLTVGRLQLGAYSATVFPCSFAAGAVAANADADVVLASLSLTKAVSIPCRSSIGWEAWTALPIRSDAVSWIDPASDNALRRLGIGRQALG